MLKNYFKIALRFMLRQKGFSLINIAGLTIGIACSLLILLYIIDEVNYDTFHQDAQRMYRLNFTGKMQGKKIESVYTGGPIAKALQNEPMVESTVRLAHWPTFPMRYENRAFTEPGLLLADSTFFRFFSFQLIEGHPDSVLLGDAKLVLSRSAAERYFDYKGPGDKTPLGKTMVLAQGYVAKVAGIAEDPPLNAHFHYSCILSLASWPDAYSDRWIVGRVITYFKLKPDNSIAEVEDVLRKFTAEYINPELKELRKVDVDQFRNQGNDLSIAIQPLLNIHLFSQLSDEIEVNGNIQYIYLFGSIAIFITLLACINFMNLSTARSATRAKEVGVRKAVGAPRSRLVAQFLLESYCYIFIAVIIALFIIMVMIGPFNVLTQKQLGSATLLSPVFLLGIAAFVFTVGLLAGSYPSFYLTQFNPIEILRGRIRLRRYGIRNILVVFQFLISAALIIATLTVYLQLRFIQRVSLGFDHRNIVNLLHAANLGRNAENFKKELLQHPDIVSASFCNRLPPNIDWQYVFKPLQSDKNYLLNVYEMDYDHIKTMKYTMVKGRFFSVDFPGDSAAVILNETAVAKMDLQTLHDQKLFTEYGNPNGMEREVIGVMQDFNFQSLKDSIQPMAIVLSRQPNWEMAIRITGQGQDKTIDDIRRLWLKHSPNAPFEYTFLDQNFDAKLRTEKRIGLLFLLFTVLAILIACLGLFGLATFTAQQRIKEIGIRKVLGASIPNIVKMLNRDFLKLVLIANLIAWPVTYWLMYQWLSQFAYHIRIPWWIFILSGTVTVVIAFLSVSSRALRAARGNPVNSLRNE